MAHRIDARPQGLLPLGVLAAALTPLVHNDLTFALEVAVGHLGRCEGHAPRLEPEQRREGLRGSLCVVVSVVGRRDAVARGGADALQLQQRIAGSIGHVLGEHRSRWLQTASAPA